MRIGIDCRLPTYRMGGISQYILHLLPALAEADSVNRFIAFHSRKESRSFLPTGAGNWQRRNLWTPCHHKFERWTLAAELVPSGLDVLHSPDFIPPRGGAARRVITIHDLNFIHFPELLTDESRRYYGDQIGWAAREADAISADSEATRRDIIENLGVSANKVKTVYLAANPRFLEQASSESVFSTLERFELPHGFFLAVGTLEPRKNLPYLLRVYARLRAEKGILDPLVLVGRKGWNYSEIFRTIETLGLGASVRHLEAVSDEALHHLYHAACALATPSLYEGFGLPALEAQHCGCPVVVSNRGSLPEIVGNRGLILDLENEDEWVDTLARVRDDLEFRGEVIDYGRQQARQFSWSKTAQQTLTLYLDSTDPALGS